MGRRKVTKKGRKTVKRARRFARPYRSQLQQQVNYAGKAAFEKKFMDTASSLFADTSSNIIQDSFQQIVQGNTPITRIGNKITVTNINIHGYVSAGKVNNVAATTDECPMFRIIVGIDKQCNGLGVTALTDVINTAFGYNGGAAPTHNAFGFRNMYNLDRFVILKDKMIASRCAGIGSASTAKLDVVIPFKFSWKGLLPVHYKANTATTGALTDVASNNLFILVISDKVDSAGNSNSSVQLVTRVKYIDA